MDKRRMCGFMMSMLLTVPVFGADVERGKELYQQKDYEAAVEELRPLLEQTEEQRQARYYLALSLIELSRLDEAAQQLGKIAEAGGMPSRADVKVAEARISKAREQFDVAATQLDEAVKLAPDHLAARMERAEIGLQRKDYKTAAEDAEKVIAAEPGNAYAYYYAGIAFSNLGRPDKMADYFQNFLKLAPKAPEAAKVQSLLRSLRR